MVEVKVNYNVIRFRLLPAKSKDIIFIKSKNLFQAHIGPFLPIKGQ